MAAAQGENGDSKEIGQGLYSLHQDKIFSVIAIICIIFAIVEVFGHLGGDGAKIAILFGIAIIAMLAPRIKNISVGSSGIEADLKEEIVNNK